MVDAIRIASGLIRDQRSLLRDREPMGLIRDQRSLPQGRRMVVGATARRECSWSMIRVQAGDNPILSFTSLQFWEVQDQVRSNSNSTSSRNSSRD